MNWIIPILKKAFGSLFGSKESMTVKASEGATVNINQSTNAGITKESTISPDLQYIVEISKELHRETMQLLRDEKECRLTDTKELKKEISRLNKKIDFLAENSCKVPCVNRIKISVDELNNC